MSSVSLALSQWSACGEISKLAGSLGYMVDIKGRAAFIGVLFMVLGAVLKRGRYLLSLGMVQRVGDGRGRV